MESISDQFLIARGVSLLRSSFNALWTSCHRPPSSVLRPPLSALRSKFYVLFSHLLLTGRLMRPHDLGIKRLHLFVLRIDPIGIL